MIFVTVGSQMAFDRLIDAVDQWAGETDRTGIFAQIGPSDFQPRHFEWTQELTAVEFREYMSKADVIVAHAGMGTILNAMEMGKPILVMPRRGDLRETRNNHQIATAKRFEERYCLNVAYDEKSLSTKLDELMLLKPSKRIGRQASPELLKRLVNFVDSV
ncbi:hypothetical protein D3OALGA1CA_2696 [Olavius algarvensis associated proteobacterium Delta 3]|nr:hypothetical protein D3OALGB2SA_2654 [Olavius algarvensis associated proteobacterium Delta 3]CAB5122954.1 hypothetical protein D3OALGA1CA_2696 [Olavius algarvensis associated proteobacterium Delta 3]